MGSLPGRGDCKCLRAATATALLACKTIAALHSYVNHVAMKKDVARAADILTSVAPTAADAHEPSYRTFGELCILRSYQPYGCIVPYATPPRGKVSGRNGRSVPAL